MTTAKPLGRQRRLRSSLEIDLLIVSRKAEATAAMLRQASSVTWSTMADGIVSDMVEEARRLLGGRDLLPREQMAMLLRNPWYGNARDIVDPHDVERGIWTEETRGLYRVVRAIRLPKIDQAAFLAKRAGDLHRVVVELIELHYVSAETSSPVRPKDINRAAGVASGR